MPSPNSNPQHTQKSREKSSSTEDSLWSKTSNPFHCSIERHLQSLSSKCASNLYHWARRLASTTGVFSASAEHAAKFFRVDRKTVLRALDELNEAGFFELQRAELFRPNVYRVVSHKEWARRHPKKCIEKDVMPWEGEGDLLGRQLFSISGQRVKFFPRQVEGLRRVGFSDGKICEHFRTFLNEAEYEGTEWKRAPFDFHEHLKTLPSGVPQNASVSAAAHNSSSAEYHGRDSMEYHRRDSAGVPSVSSAEYHGRDPSSRFKSSNEVVDREQSIPALRSQQRPSPHPTDAKAKATHLSLEEQKALILEKYPTAQAARRIR